MGTPKKSVSSLERTKDGAKTQRQDQEYLGGITGGNDHTINKAIGRKKKKMGVAFLVRMSPHRRNRRG